MKNISDLTTYELLDLIQKYCSHLERYGADTGIRHILNLLTEELERRGLRG